MWKESSLCNKVKKKKPKKEQIGIKYKNPFEIQEENKEKLLQYITGLIEMNYKVVKRNVLEILYNCFLPSQLNEMLKEDKIEFLLFDERIYLQVGKKAYRT